MPSTVNDNEEINYSCKLQAVRSVAKWLRKRKKEGKSGPYHAYFENVNQKFTKPTKSLLTVRSITYIFSPILFKNLTHI
jgi:hypothetical protein